MSKRYPGGIITNNLNITPTPEGGAPGIWTLDQALEYIKLGTWPSPTDPYFNQTTLLLHGDGTNGAQNNTFLDSSTNNFTITRNGNTTQGTFSPFSNADGEWSGYFAGGATSYIETDATTLFDQNAAATFQCWIYPTKFTTSTSAVRRMYVFIKGIIYAGLSIHSDGTLGWYGYPAGSIITASPSGTIVTNEWQHIAIVMNPSSNYIKLYKNGVEVGTSAYSAYGTDGAALRIGNGDTGQATDSFIGYMSNVKVSASVATLDYASPPVPSTTSGAGLLTLQANRFYDASGNRTVTPQASVSIQPFSPFAPSAAYSTSVNGGSGYFDGSGDELSTPDNIAFELGSSDFCIEAWVYMLSQGSSANNKTLIAHRNSSTTGYRVRFNGDEFDLQYNATTFTTSGADIPLNAWTHVAVIGTSTDIFFYKNGVQVGNIGSRPTIANDSGTVTIGGIGTQYFDGYISNLRLVLGDSVYNTAGFTPPTSPLTNITNTSLLCNFTNAGILDNTGKNNLETVGNAQIDTTTKKYGTGSMEFDGTGDYLSAVTNPNVSLGSGNFTIEGWFYITADNTYNTLLSKYSGTASTSAFEIDIRTSLGELRSQWYYGSSSTTQTISFAFSTGTWYHIAFVRSSGTLKTYIDGSEEGSTSLSVTINDGTTNLQIGGNSVDARYLNGFIDDLRITKGVARYTANFTPPGGPFQNS